MVITDALAGPRQLGQVGDDDARAATLSAVRRAGAGGARQPAWPRRSPNISYTASNVAAVVEHRPRPSPVPRLEHATVGDERGDVVARRSTAASASDGGRRPGAARTTSGGAASSSVNCPTAVRRRLRRCAPPPSSRPRSSASVRMYVPDEHSTSIVSTPACRSRRRHRTRTTVTGRGARSTSMPSRASSCRRLPSTLTADTIGGTCRMSPSEMLGDDARGRRRRHAATCRTSPSPRPTASSVDVVGAEHDLADVALARVPRGSAAGGSPLPTATTSTPVASGSSVPAWPT